jgi:hypothetical protein
MGKKGTHTGLRVCISVLQCIRVSRPKICRHAIENAELNKLVLISLAPKTHFISTKRSFHQHQDFISLAPSVHFISTKISFHQHQANFAHRQQAGNWTQTWAAIHLVLV